MKIGACPFGEAFADSPLGDLNKDGAIDENSVLNEWRTQVGLPENLYGYATKTRLHRYAECSNAGLCNREEGVCQCFAGFEGSACQRHSCPSANSEICSGNGMCLPSTLLIEMNDQSKSWEYDKFPVCKCDNGWSGVDCNRRNCPKGFDPVHQRLEYTITFGLFGEVDTTTTGKYTTPYYHFNIIYDHMKYTTITLIPRDISKCYPVAGELDPSFLAEISEEIKRAVHIVPDFTQTTVSAVCGAFNRTSGEKIKGEPSGDPNVQKKGVIVTIKLTYTDYERFYKNGFQLTVHSDRELKKDDRLTEDDIKYSGIKEDVDLTTLISNSDANKINGPEIEEKYLDECSKRGICDTQTGLCKCFDGFAGAACENQRSIAL